MGAIIWPHSRCILCLEGASLSEEHIIPRALGGRLTSNVLCTSCNNSLGHNVDFTARSDPDLVEAIIALANKNPSIGDRLLEGLDGIALTELGSVRARVRNGQVQVRSQRLDDESLLQTNSDAKRTVKQWMKKDGMSENSIAEAIQRIDSFEPGTVVVLPGGITIRPRAIRSFLPDRTKPTLGPMLPFKIAYEYLAILLGSAIYLDSPPLNEARASLQRGVLAPSIKVGTFLPSTTRVVHGIAFSGNEPHASIQICLFGAVVYRVQFTTLSINQTPQIYSYDLETKDEGMDTLEAVRAAQQDEMRRPPDDAE